MPMILVNVDEKTGFQVWRNADEKGRPVQSLEKKNQRDHVKKLLEDDDFFLDQYNFQDFLPFTDTRKRYKKYHLKQLRYKPSKFPQSFSLKAGK